MRRRKPTAATQVSIRYDALEVRVGDLVDLAMAADSSLVSKRLRIVDIAYGSEQWQRDLVCDEREA